MNYWELCFFYLKVVQLVKLGTAVAQWLRCYATNQEVAGSIPDGVIWIFHWHNPCDRTVALGLTQPLTEMSTRSISWGLRWPVLRADNLNHHHVQLSCNLGTLTFWNPLGHSGPLTKLVYLFLPFTVSEIGVTQLFLSIWSLLNYVKWRIHVIKLVIQTGFSNIYCLAERFCYVPPAPYGHNTAAVGPLLSSGLTTGTTYTWGLWLRTGFTTISVFCVQYNGI